MSKKLSNRICLIIPKKVRGGYTYEVTKEQIRQFSKLNASQKFALLEKTQQRYYQQKLKNAEFPLSRE